MDKLSKDELGERFFELFGLYVEIYQAQNPGTVGMPFETIKSWHSGFAAGIVACGYDDKDVKFIHDSLKEIQSLKRA